MKRLVPAFVLLLLLDSTVSAAKPAGRPKEPDPIGKRIVRIIKLIVQPLDNPIIPPRP